jgi:hypothetical protein
MPDTDRVAGVQRTRLHRWHRFSAPTGTPEAAIADLREALEALIAEFGAPDELTLTVDVA